MANSRNNLLFWDMATITWAHHSLISNNRKGALLGTFLTVTLAVIFTAFQWVEYHQTSFTLSDGVFGSTFFFATGLILAQYIYVNVLHKTFLNKLAVYCVAINDALYDKLFITLPASKGIDPFYLDK